MTILKEKINRINYLSFKKVNSFLLAFVLALFGYYIYQIIYISSNNISLLNFKKEFFEKKNNLNLILSQIRNRENFDPSFIKESFKMTEIERFDYIIIGPSEFVLIENNLNEGSQ